MQTINLQVEESFFPHFKALLDSFVNDKKIKIISNELPKHLTCSSVEEIRRRVYLAEKEESISEEEYNRLMDNFFREEIGIER